MFEETNPSTETNPPVEDIVSETLTPSDSETLPETNTDLTVPEKPATVLTPPVIDDSAQRRISELNKEAMTRRLEAKKLKEDLDRKEAEYAELQRQLTVRDNDLINGRTALESELKRIAAEKDAEIQKQRVEAEQSRLELLKVRIGMRFRLPESLWPRLNGTTEAELELDAASLKKSLPQESFNNDSSVGINQTIAPPSTKDMMDQRKGSYKM